MIPSVHNICLIFVSENLLSMTLFLAVKIYTEFGEKRFFLSTAPNWVQKTVWSYPKTKRYINIALFLPAMTRRILDIFNLKHPIVIIPLRNEKSFPILDLIYSNWVVHSRTTFFADSAFKFDEEKLLTECVDIRFLFIKLLYCLTITNVNLVLNK